MRLAEQQYAPGLRDRQATSRSYYYPRALTTLQIVFETYEDPEPPVTIPVIPTEVTVYSNSYKEADTWSIEFNAKDLPVSPELIRGGAVEIFLFTTPGLGTMPEVVKGIDDPDTRQIEGLEPTITGLFDDVSLEYSESGHTVKISGTDYTSLFLAKKWREYEVKTDSKSKKKKKRRCPSGKKLNIIIQNLMNEVESVKGNLTLKVEPKELIKQMPVVGAAESKSTKSLSVRNADTYWDVMYDLVVRYGFIIFVRNHDVVITQPNAYLKSKSTSKKMAWGQNLSRLEISRKIGQQQVPVVEIRSYDSVDKVVRKARYPSSRKQQPVTGLGTNREEIRVYNIPGVRSDKILRDSAKTAYELLARAEQSIEIETRDLLDLEGSDLIGLKTGDSLTIGIEPNTTDLLSAMTRKQRDTKLRQLGYEPLVAFEIALAFEKAGQFRKPFRVREATIQWSNEDGITIQASLQNFVNIVGQEP